MIHSNENGPPFYKGIEEIKADGLYAIHMTSILQLFRLKGRTNVISVDNFELIPDMQYAHYSRPSKDSEPVYYVYQYRGWGLNPLWFYRPDYPMLEISEEVDIFRARIRSGEIWLLFTAEQVADTTAMLKRIYKGQTKQDGKLPYKHFIELMEYEVKYNDYRITAKDHTGYKTACKIFEGEIAEIWKRAKESQK